jgi:hypothetical protein
MTIKEIAKYFDAGKNTICRRLKEASR